MRKKLPPAEKARRWAKYMREYRAKKPQICRRADTASKEKNENSRKARAKRYLSVVHLRVQRDPEYAERRREYSRKWRRTNLEKAQESSKRTALKSKERRQSDPEWREQLNAKNRQRAYQRWRNDPEWRKRQIAATVKWNRRKRKEAYHNPVGELQWLRRNKSELRLLQAMLSNPDRLEALRSPSKASKPGSSSPP